MQNQLRALQWIKSHVAIQFVLKQSHTPQLAVPPFITRPCKTPLHAHPRQQEELSTPAAPAPQVQT